jgi:hypothetical protein
MTPQPRYKYVEYLHGQWLAVVKVNGQELRAGLFPLTDAGERMAHEAAALRLKQHRNAALVAKICRELEIGAIHYDDVYRIISATQINNPARRPDINVITDIVCDYFGVTYAYIAQNSRRNKIRYPRQVCMYIMRKFGHTLYDIGKYFGKDHTTVLHTHRMICDTMEIYPHISATIKSLEYKIITHDTIRTIRNRPTQDIVPATDTPVLTGRAKAKPTSTVMDKDAH